MFRALAILVVVLVAAVVLLVFIDREVVRPRRRRRHIAELEAENERLDALISGINESERRKP
jgi:flagellar biosynthesis/type III secretory pathway M-ring protein FliF/YscJ